MNNSCLTATPITVLPFTDTVNVSAYSADPSAVSTCAAHGYQAAWYTFTATFDVTLVIDNFQSDYDSELALFSGACGSLTQLQCNEDYDLVGVSSPSFQAAICCGVKSGSTVYIAATSFANNVTTSIIRVTPLPATTSRAPRLVGVGAMAGTWLGGATTPDPALIVFDSDGTRLTQVPSADSQGNQTTPKGQTVGGRYATGSVWVVADQSPVTLARYVDGLGLLAWFVAIPSMTADAVAADGTDRAIVGYTSNVLVNDPVKIARFLPDGSAAGSWTTNVLPPVGEAITVADVEVLANSTTVLFAVYSSDHAQTRLVYAYDLNSSSNLSHFADTGANQNVQSITLNPAGDKVWLALAKTDGSASEVRRYSLAGALERTYTIGAFLVIGPLAVDPTRFWICHDDENAFGYRISDGVNDKTWPSTIEPAADISGLMARAAAAPVTPLSVTSVTGDCDANTLTIHGVSLETYATISVDGPDGSSETYTVTSLAESEIVLLVTNPLTAGEYCVTVDALDPACCSVSCVGETFPICRRRRFPLPFEQNKLITIYRIEFLIQSGVSPDSSMTARFSRDGGNTWPISRSLTAGALGDFGYRVYTTNLGQGRNWVCELSTSAPYFWALIQCYADIEMGTS